MLICRDFATRQGYVLLGESSMEKAHTEVRPSFVYRDLSSKPVTHFEWVYKNERMKVYSEPIFRTREEALSDLSNFVSSMIHGKD